MFHEHDRASEHVELSAELKALEQRLAEQPLVAPRIDRDRLMFAAGQAAATYIARPSWPEASTPSTLRAHHPPTPSWAASRFWPAATATMTAATVVLAAMLFWPSDEPQEVVERGEPAPATGVMEVAVEDVVVDDVPTLTANRDFRDPWLFTGDSRSGHLTARGMVLPRDANSLARDDRSSARDMNDYDEPPRKSATARELMEELLPETAQRPQHNS